MGARIEEVYGWTVLKNQEAFLQAVQEHDILNVAGTGSGKTECSIFLICEEVRHRAQGGGTAFASANRVALYLFPNNGSYILL